MINVFADLQMDMGRKLEKHSISQCQCRRSELYSNSSIIFSDFRLWPVWCGSSHSTATSCLVDQQSVQKEVWALQLQHHHQLAIHHSVAWLKCHIENEVKDKSVPDYPPYFYPAQSIWIFLSQNQNQLREEKLLSKGTWHRWRVLDVESLKALLLTGSWVVTG